MVCQVALAGGRDLGSVVRWNLGKVAPRLVFDRTPTSATWTDSFVIDYQVLVLGRVISVRRWTRTWAGARRKLKHARRPFDFMSFKDGYSLLLIHNL